MMLDADFVIDVMKEGKSAVEKLKTLAVRRGNYAISAPSIFELYVGVALSKRTWEEQDKVLRVLSDFGVVPLSVAQAKKAGEIH